MNIFPRDISWLSFNDRVLQEAQDVTNPLLERLKFLGIFSSNQDEFFRVRYATQRRIALYNDGMQKDEIQKESRALLNRLQKKVIAQQKKFNDIYQSLIEELAENKIFLVNENQLSETQLKKVRNYFKESVLETLFPIILGRKNSFPFLKDRSIYLAIKMTKRNAISKKYALLEIPPALPRFFVIKENNGNQFVLFLDDVIRASMDVLFQSLYYDEFAAFTIKLTRDAELDLLGDLDDDYLEVIKKSLKQRQIGAPVRLIYDEKMDADLFEFITNKLSMKSSALIAGQRYHNFKDFIMFPNLGNAKFLNPVQKNVPNLDLDKSKSILRSLQNQDFILHHPYHSFDYILRLLREAAIDPKVFEIKMTLYRVAGSSNVVKALKNAVRNGKKVTVIMELQARFDEEANIVWAHQLMEEGAKVVYGFPNKKVHTKLCLIYRKQLGKIFTVAHIGTGNYNEQTANLYSDFSIMTANPIITKEANKVFNIIEKQKIPASEHFENLLVSPFNTRSKVIGMINNEISLAKNGKKASLIIKVNSLTDPKIIETLQKAVSAGVSVNLIVRSICCLIHKGEKNLTIISIVDKFLEHARVMWFNNDGKEKLFLGSADMMERNIDNRFEITIPVLDKTNVSLLKSFLHFQLKDNVKARVIDAKQLNNFVENKQAHTRSQIEWANYLSMY